jgi:hypothetical protein
MKSGNMHACGHTQVYNNDPDDLLIDYMFK